MARVIILSGAGISVESGISTFRDGGGIWDNHNISEVCNFDSLEKNEEKTIAFYDQQRVSLQGKKPNYAHKVVAELKLKYKDDIAVVTQNVDDLFERAGLFNGEVLHLHGFLTHVRCMNVHCNRFFNIFYNEQSKANNGYCPACQSKFRPDVVFFGEPVPLYMLLNKELIDCEMLVIIGSSGKVMPFNNVVNCVPYTILNNLEKSLYIDDTLFTKVIYDKATKAISEIKNDIERFLSKN